MNTSLDYIRPDLIRAVQLAAHRLQRLLELHPGQFPTSTLDGKWIFDLEGHISGYEGYLPGQLWLLYRMTRDAWLRAAAERLTIALEALKIDPYAPNLGQIFMPTWKRWYEFSNEPVLNQVLIDAGRTLAARYLPQAGYLHAHNSPSTLHIDSLLDLPLVFYAAQQTGDPHLLHVARSHTETARRYLVRGDGSTAEEALFEVDSGQFLRELSRLGWRSDSCWARGLAAAIYGFSTIYTYTHDSRDISTAENCARYYLEHTPEHGVPPNDFNEPEPSTLFDSSAAALAAGGFWQLAALVPDSARAWVYRQYALRILESLTLPQFLTYEDPEWEGMLKHAAPNGESNRAPCSVIIICSRPSGRSLKPTGE
jgi:unsaturated chondroitin disaccharide hydrolase